MEHHGPATILHHCAVFGDSKTEVCWIETCEPRPYAQCPTCVEIVWIQPGKRKKALMIVKPDNLKYAEIEVAGKIVYDSRQEIPCDMEKWSETKKRIADRPAWDSDRPAANLVEKPELIRAVPEPTTRLVCGLGRYQVMPPLAPDEYTALKADILLRGVLVAIEKDETGNTLDGNHREQIVSELRAEGHQVADSPVVVRAGLTEPQKRSHGRALNVNRRQLTRDQRRQIIEDELKDNPGKSNRQIGGALGADHKTVATIREDLSRRGEIPHVSTTTDTRGRRQPVRRPRPAPLATKAQCEAPEASSNGHAQRAEQPPSVNVQQSDGEVIVDNVNSDQKPLAPPSITPEISMKWRATLSSFAIGLKEQSATIMRESKAKCAKRDLSSVLDTFALLRNRIDDAERAITGQ
jgi:hypothetical protein